MRRKYLTIILSVLLIFTLNVSVYAQSENQGDKIDSKIEKQNQDILSKAKEIGSDKNGKEFDNLLNQFDKNKKEDKELKTSKEIKEGLFSSFFNLSLTSRKFTVPIFMILLLFNIILCTTLGAKSISKRKQYIFGSISLSILFLFMMNTSLFILYFQSNNIAEIFSADEMYKNLFEFIFFLRDNSPAMATLLCVYGIVNLILGKKDIRKRMLGAYMVKGSFILLIVMVTIPFIMQLII